MENYFLDLMMALWLGILTSISPCPLATNIAAISYISKNMNNKNYVLLSGLFYTTGRMMAYLILSIILVSSTQYISPFAMFLQKYMNIFLGPVLIIISLILLDIIKIGKSYNIISEHAQKRLAKSGFLGTFALGVTFALSFCPVSAALFFGNTIALSIKYKSIFLIPSFFGLGTGAPVFIFAIIIALSFNAIGIVYNKIRTFELRARKISGIIFLLAGIYYIFNYII